MISEEEKEAIKYVKEQINYFEKQIEFIKATNSDYYDEELELYENRVKQFSLVLNLIEKQNKEIEHLKNLNKHQSKEITKAVNYTFELNKEIEIKDKIIDSMSDFIDDNLTDCILNTMNIDEPCSKHTNREMLCKECIKEYFRKKVEENG